MTVDREQIRQALLAWQVEITTPGDATTDSWHALQDVVFGNGPELLLALLADLEQAEKNKQAADVEIRALYARLEKADKPAEALRYIAADPRLPNRLKLMADEAIASWEAE